MPNFFFRLTNVELTLAKYFHYYATHFVTIFIAGVLVGLQMVTFLVSAVVPDDTGIRLSKESYSIGQQSDNIKSLQEFLKQKGYFKHPSITGYFGPITNEAVISYRVDNNITAGQFAKVDPNRCVTLIKRDFAYATSNGEVADLQKCLTDIGLFNPDLITSFYGPITTKAHTVARKSIGSLSSNQTNNNNPIPQNQIDELSNLINSNRIIGPNYGDFDIIGSVRNGKIAKPTVELMILLTKNFDTLHIVSLYRPYDSSPGHPGGLAIDINALTTGGKYLTHTQAFEGNGEALNAFGKLGEILKQSRGVNTVITAGKVKDKLTFISGFRASQNYGSVDNISVMTTGGNSATEKHEDHIHIEVIPGSSINMGVLVDTPQPPQNQAPATQASSDQLSQPISTDPCQKALNDNYSIGQQGPAVETVQKCLQDLKLYSWPYGVTGYFGSYTNSILSQYKQKSPSNCSDLKAQKWQKGETSDRVKRLQECMKTAGTFTYPYITGYFGDITEKALANWK